MIQNPIPWPHGARCAVAFTFDMDADSSLHLAHHTSADTRVAAISMLRYGPEVAVHLKLSADLPLMAARVCQGTLAWTSS